MESCQNPNKPLNLPTLEGTDTQFASSIKHYQQGFNDRQMGREKRVPTGTMNDWSYAMGWHDAKPGYATNPQMD